MTKLQKILIISLTLVLFFTLATIGQAAENTKTSPPSDFDTYLKIVGQAPGYDLSPGLSGFPLPKIMAFVISLVGIIFFILIIFSGFQWMTAEGNEDKISGAKKRITRASVGLGITLCAFIISYTAFSFFYQEYLETPYGGIEAPPGSQDTIPCANNPECAGSAPRIYCLEGNCAECTNDQSCLDNPHIGRGLMHCHPSWHICMLPEGATCDSINSPGLCQAQNCKWIVTGEGDNGRWAGGRCVDSNHPCPQCLEDAPICTEIRGQGMNCVECLQDQARGACAAYQACWGQICFP